MNGLQRTAAAWHIVVLIPDDTPAPGLVVQEHQWPSPLPVEVASGISFA